ncbi:hypothetical protein [Maribacter litoralis]|uniref:hypothetical protein n=1 Tax=Maribacter litoralis TaxID=2059726 RepID=UPI003F5CF7C0
MKLTRQAISNTNTVIPGIEGYLTLVHKVENNVDVNPDIAIESCKSLIEGLCLKTLSLLSDKYKASKSVRVICKQNLNKLTAMAFDEVYSSFVERQVHESLATLVIDISVTNKIKNLAKRKVKEQAKEAVAKISALRNERGDISHGRDYPKNIESSINLAKSIQSITDGICSFMIEEIGLQFQTKNKDEKKLIYQELEDFNTWLDETHNILSIKVDYSKILYENAPDKYEEFYYSEYLETIDSGVVPINEYVKHNLSIIIQALRENAVKLETKKSQIKDKEVDKKEPEVIVEVENSTLEYLVNKFNEDLFWTEKRSLMLSIFVADEKLKQDKFKELVNDILFTEKEPLRDDVRDVMIKPPALLESKKVLPELTAKILKLIEELKAEAEE